MYSTTRFGFSCSLIIREKLNSCILQSIPKRYMVIHIQKGTIVPSSKSTPRMRENNNNNNDKIIQSTNNVTDVPYVTEFDNFHEPIHVLGGGSIGLLWSASIRLCFPSYPIKVLRRTTAALHVTATTILVEPIVPLHGKLDVSLSVTYPNLSQTPTGLVKHNSRQRPRMIQVPYQIVQQLPLQQQQQQQQQQQVGKPIKNLIVTTKATQAMDAIKSVMHLLNEQTHIILLCNGAMAVREEMNALLFVNKSIQQKNIHIALTTHGVYREMDDTTNTMISSTTPPPSSSSSSSSSSRMWNVIHAGYGETILENYPTMANLWNVSGLNCQSVDTETITNQLWLKLATNCVINPISAIHNCPNGDIVSIPDFQHIYSTILKEIATIWVAVESQTTTTTTTTEKEVVELIENKVRVMTEYVDTVIHNTGGNRSSMLQDILAHRPTEIDYLSGYVVMKGKELGISCSMNEIYWHKVKEISST